MPRVPTYDSPQVRNAALPGVRVSSPGPSGLEELGAGLSRVAGVVGQIANEEYAKAAAADATNGETELQGVATKLFHDDQNGLFNKRGQQAFDAEKPTFEEFAAQRERIAKSLKSDSAREMFLARTGGLEQSLRRQTETHFAREREVGMKEAAERRSQAGIDAIVAGGWADDAQVETQARMMSTAAAALASSAEGKEQAATEARQRAYTAAITMRLDRGDVKGAQAMLVANEEMLGRHAPALRKRLEKETDAGSAAQEAARMVESTKDESGRYDVAKAREMLLEKGVAPAVREVALERLKLIEEAMEERADRQLDELRATFSKVGTLNHPKMRALKEWFLDPKNRATKHWDAFERNLIAERNANRTAGVEARRAQAEMDAYLKARFRALETSDQLGVNVDNHPEFSAASRVAREEIRGDQKKVKEMVEKGQRPKLNQIDEIAKAAAGQAGITDAKEIAKFTAQLKGRWLEKMGTNGELPTNEEVQKDVGDLLLKSGMGIFGRERFRFQVSDDTEFIPDPAEEQPYAPNRGARAVPAQSATPAERPDKSTRMRQLKAQGMKPADIVRTMNAEGY